MLTRLAASPFADNYDLIAAGGDYQAGQSTTPGFSEAWAATEDLNARRRICAEYMRSIFGSATPRTAT
ncbi:hypothetical protein [Frankia gtarii]|uniref:hypothetical protein n=1 Tax=Frankia gtarii TaxID=2950102 RepID=UPI0021C0BE93|nr:hypothetical protein [Frankia gtarii]